jgi:hypothetical protein
MYLLAPTALRVAPDDFPGRVRARFANDLRRAGRFAQLCLLGAQACLEGAGGDGPLGVLWGTRLGPLHGTRAALDDGLRRGEPTMPFAFIAAQPHLAGALLAQRGLPVARTACLYLAPEAWTRLLLLGGRWLVECERVLLGWVEESETGGTAHCSDWCLLRGAPVPGAIRCERMPERSAAAAAEGGDWIARVGAWRAAPHAPLLLGGSEGAWRFALQPQ